MMIRVCRTWYFNFFLKKKKSNFIVFSPNFRITYTIFLLLGAFPLLSNSSIDSLKTALISAEGAVKTEIYSDLYKLSKFSNAEEALTYLMEGIEYARKEDLTEELGKMLNRLGNFHKANGNFIKAFDASFEALNIVEKLGDEKKVAAFKNNIGLIYFKLQDYEKTLSFLVDALILKEKLNLKASASKTLNNIGMVYGRLKNNEKALEYYKRSIDIKKELGNKKSLSMTLNNIGYTYEQMGKYEEALKYHYQSLNLKEEIKYQKGISVALNNIGSVYLDLHEYQKAFEYLTKSLTIRKTIDDIDGQALTHTLIGKAQSQLGQLEESLSNHLLALEFATSVNSLSVQQRIYKNLADVYILKMDFEKAWKAERSFNTLADTILEETVIKKLADIQMNYEIAKKNERIVGLEKERKLHKRGLVASGIAVIMLIAFLTSLYYRFQANRKANKLLSEKNKAYFNQNEKITRINRELGQFAYVVSHDLKAPLRAIASLTTFLEEDLSDRLKPDESEKLGLLKGRIKRMERLINGILEYSRIGRVNVEKKLVDVLGILPDVVDTALISADRKVTFNLPTSLPTLIGNPILIEQVFQNLINNAIKYNDKETCEILISYKEMSKFHRFSVKDNGPGISTKYHEKIFQIFQTLQPRDEIESTGIGLSIIKKIIEEQGNGEIWVESEIGKGTTFFFTWAK